MRPWWRAFAALLLPFAVPAVITVALFALPGDPAELICPPQRCVGTQALAESWNLHRGPWAFYIDWMDAAFRGDLGNSWRVVQGTSVAKLVTTALPNTLGLVLLSMLGLFTGSLLGLVRGTVARLDVVWQVIGLAPAVMVALTAAAWVELTYGALSYGGVAGLWRLGLGAAALVLADGALANAVTGTRQTFESELTRRYIEVARLRGESVWANALPNLLPALARQWRARWLAVLSSLVVVEVVLRIEGLGELLFVGTLQQDFGIVLAATWLFAVASAAALLLQAVVDAWTSRWIRRVPVGWS
ncbi:MAG: ABC transporter permease subunit [Myxococcota bacterium]